MPAAFSFSVPAAELKRVVALAASLSGDRDEEDFSKILLMVNEEGSSLRAQSVGYGHTMVYELAILDGKFAAGLDMLIPLRMLHRLLGGLPDVMLTVQPTPKGTVRISAGRNSWHLPLSMRDGQWEYNFIEMPEIYNDATALSFEKLQAALETVSVVVNDDPSNGREAWRSGICLDPFEGGTHVVASDGVRLCVFRFPEKLVDERVILPGLAARWIARLSPLQSEVLFRRHLTDVCLVLSERGARDARLYLASYAMNYPAWERILPAGPTTEVWLSQDELREFGQCLVRMSCLALHGVVTLQVDNGLVVTAGDSEEHLGGTSFLGGANDVRVHAQKLLPLVRRMAHHTEDGCRVVLRAGAQPVTLVSGKGPAKEASTTFYIQQLSG